MGWGKRAPKTRGARRALYAACGQGAFLEPNHRDPGLSKYPVMTRQCVLDCRGLQAAASRAAQQGARRVAREAKRLQSWACLSPSRTRLDGPAAFTCLGRPRGKSCEHVAHPCSACGGPYHPATGHAWTKDTVLCQKCARYYMQWVRENAGTKAKRRGDDFSTAALTSIKPRRR